MKLGYWIIGIIIVAAIGYLLWGSGAPQAPGDSQSETTEVLVFFTRITERDMEFVPVTRTVPDSDSYEELALAAMRELVDGPTAAEQERGLSAGFNPRTQVNSVNKQGYVVTVDFNDQIDFQIGGSALVISLRGMIERTIRQFPGWGDALVRWTVDGKRDAILEP